MSSKLTVAEITSTTGVLTLSNQSTLDMSGSTDSFVIPRGTTGDRSGASPSEGAIRWNDNYKSLEVFDGNYWNTLKTIPSGIVTDGLVVHFDPTNPDCYPGSGDTFVNLAGVQGQFGQKYGTTSVDTVNGWIDLGSGQDTTNYFSFDKNLIEGLRSWTLDLWMYIHAGNSIDTFFETGASNDMLFIFENNRTSVQFQNINPYNAAYETAIGEAFHFTAVGTPSYLNPTGEGNGTVDFYKNGEYISSTESSTYVDAPATLARGVIMGQELDSNSGSLDAGQKYRGKFGQIKFYRKPLTPLEVKQNFLAHKDFYGVS